MTSPATEEEYTGMENEEENVEFLYKILVVGDIGAGKTSLIKRMVHGIFSMHYKSTIGVDFALKVLRWDDHTEIRLQLWDIAGQERFGHMTRVYYREAVGAFIVFDITRANTFEAVAQWKSDIDDKVTWGPDNRPIPVVLLANKCDLPKETYCKSADELERYAADNKFIGWYHTSAKDNKGIDQATQHLVKFVLDHDQRHQPAPDSNIIIPRSTSSPEPTKDTSCFCNGGS
ncbi:Rab GTPase [Pelomyxa schiedti]|nr:Rab GTPase [Pelomyxa schiedti]